MEEKKLLNRYNNRAPRTLCQTEPPGKSTIPEGLLHPMELENSTHHKHKQKDLLAHGISRTDPHSKARTPPKLEGRRIHLPGLNRSTILQSNSNRVSNNSSREPSMNQRYQNRNDHHKNEEEGGSAQEPRHKRSSVFPNIQEEEPNMQTKQATMEIKLVNAQNNLVKGLYKRISNNYHLMEQRFEETLLELNFKKTDAIRFIDCHHILFQLGFQLNTYQEEELKNKIRKSISFTLKAFKKWFLVNFRFLM
jgi:hypothetical protein